MTTLRGIAEHLNHPMALMGMVIWILCLVVFMFKKDRTYGRFAFWTFVVAGFLVIGISYMLAGKGGGLKTRVEAIPVTLQEETGDNTGKEGVVAPPSVPEGGDLTGGRAE